MKPVEVSLEQVLLARENRAGRQQRLLAQYGLPLVSFTMNMAGPVKDTPLSRFAFQAGVAALTKRLGGPVSCCLTEAVTGCEALLVYDRPAQVLKDVCMELESTEVGRLYDLDVLDAAGEKLSRPEMRRCLVCGGPVAVCSRSRAHGLDAICAETTRRLAEFACTTLGDLAADALREEAALSPKPGLVDARTNGAHTDMDLLLMLRSAETLRPWFCRMVRLGLDGAAPAQLQNAGRQAEAQMLQATGGVNTHKGALYALSLLLAAMGRHLSGAQESVFSLAAADAAALAPPVGTHGSQVRRRYGRPGAREEAMDGFPSLQALLQATRSQPPLGVLLWSMAHLSDSNLLYRGGEAGLAFAQNEAERILRLPQTQWEAELTALDAEMTRRNLSPGGSADLLALTLFSAVWISGQSCPYKNRSLPAFPGGERLFRDQFLPR